MKDRGDEIFPVMSKVKGKTSILYLHGKQPENAWDVRETVRCHLTPQGSKNAEK